MWSGIILNVLLCVGEIKFPLHLQLSLHWSKTDISAAGPALCGFRRDFDMKEPFQMDGTYFLLETAGCIYDSPPLTVGDTYCQQCFADQLKIIKLDDILKRNLVLVSILIGVFMLSPFIIRARKVNPETLPM